MRKCPICRLSIVPKRWKVHLARHKESDEALLRKMREFFGFSEDKTLEERAHLGRRQMTRRKRPVQIDDRRSYRS